MSLEIGRLEQLKHAHDIYVNTSIGISHFITTFQYRTRDEINNIISYTSEILSSLITVLGWNLERSIYIYERPAQVLTTNLVDKLNTYLRNYANFNNEGRLLLLNELRNDLISIKQVIKIGLDNARLEWRRMQTS